MGQIWHSTKLLQITLCFKEAKWEDEIKGSIGTTYPDLNIEDKIEMDGRDIYMYIDQDQDATIADQVNSQEQTD